MLGMTKKSPRPAKSPAAAALGARVRGLRESLGLTQEVLAEKAGLTKSHVGTIELGHVTTIEVDTLKKLAAALNVLPIQLDPELCGEIDPLVVEVGAALAADPRDIAGAMAMRPQFGDEFTREEARALLQRVERLRKDLERDLELRTLKKSPINDAN